MSTTPDPNRTTHTPGPWTTRKSRTSVQWFVEGSPTQQSGWSLLIAEVRGRLNQNEANAHLIAAAPDLLVACKAALGAFEHNHAIDWNDLERAIDKAEGR